MIISILQKNFFFTENGWSWNNYYRYVFWFLNCIPDKFCLFHILCCKNSYKDVVTFWYVYDPIYYLLYHLKLILTTYKIINYLFLY